MFFRQILHRDLGCASYLVADGGVAAVVDPKWEIEEYLRLAEEEGFEITHILETHNHADHLSGRGRLAEATGATIHVPNAEEVAFAAKMVGDGDAVEIGGARIVALATPGHRPEHVAYLVHDTSRGQAPWLVLTGDSLFVGDLARPDLAVEAEQGARELHRSLRTLLALDDYVHVYPGHIGGSLCGGAGMSENPASTIGFERRFNPFLAIADEDAFVAKLTSELQSQPPNFERIVELNRGPLLRHAAPLEPLAPRRVAELLETGAIVLDGREPREFDAEHIPGSLSTTMVKAAVGTRAAWVVDPEDDVIAVAAGDAEAQQMLRMLEAVGFRRLRGYLAGGLAAWREAGRPILTTAAIDIPTLAAKLQAGEVELLDVREQDEWDQGHVEGSLFAPYHELRDGPPRELGERNGKPLAVACSVGNRSSLAVSLLERHEVDDLLHVADGGVADLAEHGVELVTSKS
jgi:glyoxylase-like metal-dependent hydrolase (beta-lactamase superfamily II)/rhodanese-related sulfurtransferase